MAWLEQGWGKAFRSTVKGMLVGFALGYLLAFLFSASIWLEMRVTTGRSIPFAMICVSALSLRYGFLCRFSIFLSLEVLAVTAISAIPSFPSGALPVVPAALLREGFGLVFLSLTACNVILGLFLIISHAAWSLAIIRANSKRRYSAHRPGSICGGRQGVMP